MCGAQGRVAGQGGVQPGQAEASKKNCRLEFKCPGKLKRDEAQSRSSRFSDVEIEKATANAAQRNRWSFHHHDDVFAFDTAEKTDKVTTNVASDGPAASAAFGARPTLPSRRVK